MTIASCVIIAGSLWMTAPGNIMVQPLLVHKDPGDETVLVIASNGGRTTWSSEQYQVRMGSEEYLADCVLSGYTIEPMYLHHLDDIDDEETTGMGEQ